MLQTFHETELRYTIRGDHNQFFVLKRDHFISTFDVQLTAEGLEATARGEPLDAARHQLEHEVKAITYHALKVVREGDAWLAEVILDI